MHENKRTKNMTPEIQREVASSLLVCMGDIFEYKVKNAFEQYPEVHGFSFVGGVAANDYLGNRLKNLCERYGKQCVIAPRIFCGDNAAMVAFVGEYKAQRNQYSDFTLDVFSL